jgi:hypothetical protein
MLKSAPEFLERNRTRPNPGIFNSVTQFFNLLVSFIVKLFVGVMAVLFALSLVVAGLIYLGFASLRFLVTGRKPAVAVMFTQFRQMQRAAASGVWPAARRDASGQHRPASSDVVDVEMREIEVDRAAPPASGAHTDTHASHRDPR